MSTIAMPTARQLLSGKTSIIIRCALRQYRDWYLSQWLLAQENGNTSDDCGTAFWAGRIQEVNDAALEFTGGGD